MLAKPLLFLSSYAPLFALLAIRIDTTSIRIACIALTLVGVASLFAVLTLDRRSTRAESTVVTVRNAGSEAASYLAGYLLPFLVITTPTLRDVIAYILFILVVAIVTVKTGVIQVNPLLFLFGYSVFRVIDSTGAEFYTLSRGRLAAGVRLVTTSLSDDVIVNRPA